MGSVDINRDPAGAADALKPFIIPWIESAARKGISLTGVNTNGVGVHDLDGGYHTGSLSWSRVSKVGSSVADLDNHSHNALSDLDYAASGHMGFAGTGVSNTFAANQNIKAISLTGSIEPWTTAAWGKPLEMPGPGQAFVWPKGGSAYSWGIGASGGNLYFGHSTADDNSAAVTYDLVMDGTFLRSSNYASRVSGWSIDSLNGAADFQYLFTKQLHAEIFVADLTRALAGIEVVTKSVTLLDADFVIPYPGTTATLRVKDLPSAAGMQVFEPGDYVNPPTFDRSGGALTIGDCWGTVSSPVNNGDGSQSWTFARTGTVTYKTISQRGTAVGTSSSSTATVSLAKPTGTVANDFLLVQINYVGTHTLSSPVSYPFTRLIQRTAGGNTMEIWYRLAGSSEPSTYDFTFEAACNCAGHITAWQNVGVASTYIDNSLSQVNASSTSMSVAPGLTPRSAAGMLLYYGMAAGNIRATPPSGMTELADAGTGSAQHYLASQLLSSASATGAKTATLASAAANAAALVLLMPGYTSMSTQAGAALPLTTIQAVDGNEGAVLDYGVAGNGYVEINAIDGVRGVNSPYIRVVTFSGHPADSKTVRSQMGNLRGLFGVTGEYGFYGGDGTAVTDKYFRLSSYIQEIHNLPIKMYSSSTLTVELDNANGIGLKQDSYGNWAGIRALEWWPDLASKTGSPSLQIRTGLSDIPASFDYLQDYCEINAAPTGGRIVSLRLLAMGAHATAPLDAMIAMYGGDYTNVADSSITMYADSFTWKPSPYNFTLPGPLPSTLATLGSNFTINVPMVLSTGATLPLELKTSSAGPYSLALTRTDIPYTTRLFNDGTGMYFEHAPRVPHLRLVDGVTAPSTVSGMAMLYVDSADGDLKIKFGDGTIKTIAVDT